LYAHRQDCKGRYETYNAYRHSPWFGSADRVRFPEQDEFARPHGAVKRDRIDWHHRFVFIFFIFAGGRPGGITRQLALRGHMGGTILQWSAEYHKLHRPSVANRRYDAA
jgi:hypothetical protein